MVKWKLMGVLLTILGGIATLASNYVEDKKLEETVAEEVKKQLADSEEES